MSISFEHDCVQEVACPYCDAVAGNKCINLGLVAGFNGIHLLRLDAFYNKANVLDELNFDSSVIKWLEN